MTGRREITLRAVDAFNRHDVAGLQALLTPDVEMVPMRAVIDGTYFTGPRAAALFFAAIDETWEALHVEADEIRVSDPGVFATGHIRASGRESGAEVVMDLAWILRFDDGVLVKSLRTYVDLEQAQKDAAALGIQDRGSGPRS